MSKKGVLSVCVACILFSPNQCHPKFKCLICMCEWFDIGTQIWHVAMGFARLFTLTLAIEQSKIYKKKPSSEISKWQ